MKLARKLHGIMKKLPHVRGQYLPGAPMSKLIWFRTGGAAEVLFKPADEADLKAFLEGADPGVSVTMLGMGSNVIVRDGGIRGVVVKLGKPFADVRIEGDRIIAGAGAIDLSVANKAADAGIAGLEFLRGVPGTIGGAVVTNAGAYGGDVARILESARFLDRQGHEHVLSVEEMGYGYRSCNIPGDWIVVEATFRGELMDQDLIMLKMAEIVDSREESQPLRTRTSGSTFKNPNVTGVGDKSAWQLIDQAGCRGLRVRGAQISEKHCNFMINTGLATAADLEELGEEVIRRVKEVTGVELEWEIVRLGNKTDSAV